MDNGTELREQVDENSSDDDTPLEKLISRVALLEDKFLKLHKTIKSCCKTLLEKEIFSNKDFGSINKLLDGNETSNTEPEKSVPGSILGAKEKSSKDNISGNKEDLESSDDGMSDDESSEQDFTSDEEVTKNIEERKLPFTRPSQALMMQNNGKSNQLKIGAGISIKRVGDQNVPMSLNKREGTLQQLANLRAGRNSPIVNQKSEESKSTFSNRLHQNSVSLAPSLVSKSV